VLNVDVSLVLKLHRVEYPSLIIKIAIYLYTSRAILLGN
jgi:hypothetical protein